MRDWDNSLLLQLIADEATTFWLADMQMSDETTLYYTTLDIDIAWDGTLYLTEEFKVDPISYSADMSVDKYNLEFSNVDLGFSAILLGNDVTKRPATIYIGAMDGMTPVAAPVFYGLVGAWEIRGDKAVIPIVDELVYWSKRTLRLPSDKCPWVFKGPECRYDGNSLECDKTYARCSVLFNTDNYGGFRFFPDIEEKEVWWGKEQE